MNQVVLKQKNDYLELAVQHAEMAPKQKVSNKVLYWYRYLFKDTYVGTNQNNPIKQQIG